MTVTTNPYATSRTEEEFQAPVYAQGPHSRYAVPNLEVDAPWIDSTGWAPSLRLGPNETPDAARIGTLPTRDFHRGSGPGTEGFFNQRDNDPRTRHTVEQIDANGFPDVKGIQPGERRWSPDPKSVTVPESRTSRHPRSYAFLRSFGNGGYGTPKVGERSLNGVHFSMADHRRNYDILGMAPVSSRRNTYRIEPTPWDTDLVDVPAETDYLPNARIQAIELDRSSRSWRLN